jgi:hypothetical protein
MAVSSAFHACIFSMPSFLDAQPLVRIQIEWGYEISGSLEDNALRPPETGCRPPPRLQQPPTGRAPAAVLATHLLRPRRTLGGEARLQPEASRRPAGSAERPAVGRPASVRRLPRWAAPHRCAASHGEPPGFLLASALRRAGFHRRREDFWGEAAGHGEEMGQMVGGGADILPIVVRSRFLLHLSF